LKKRGRFVLEAALLVPGACILLVYLVYFTLFAHDYAVVAHTALESGVKGIYRDGQSDAQCVSKIKKDLDQKLSERTLWILEPQAEVQVNSIKAEIHISGQGSFLSGNEISMEQTLYRIQPCTIIRRSMRLRE
jgi:hypothetical protein